MHVRLCVGAFMSLLASIWLLHTHTHDKQTHTNKKRRTSVGKAIDKLEHSALGKPCSHSGRPDLPTPNAEPNPRHVAQSVNMPHTSLNCRNPAPYSAQNPHPPKPDP